MVTKARDSQLPRTSLRGLFLGLQEKMLAELSYTGRSIEHPTAKGDAGELSWLDMLKAHLPDRYRAEKAFVVDADGHLSQQIDIVIFDQHYSPFLLNHKGAFYVPAESVYAVIEVKPLLDRRYVKYAAEKAASVRRLRRTSAPICYADGVYPPKAPFDILAGIVTAKSSWKPAIGKGFESAIGKLEVLQKLDIGCALQEGAGFEITYTEEGKATIIKSRPRESLMFFFLSLLARLQQMGTVPAIDLHEYAKSLNK